MHKSNKFKTTFNLDTPFSTATWYVKDLPGLLQRERPCSDTLRPEVSLENQATILELLCRQAHKILLVADVC